MPRVIVCFLGGLLAGFVGAYGLCMAVVFVFFQSDVDAVRQESKITGEYEAWYAKSVQRPVLVIATSAAIICGSLGGMTASRVTGRPRVRRARAPAGGYDDAPLQREEFERVLQACLFARLAERSPDYAQGVIVGRFAESDPDLARRLARFSPRHMEALWSDLVRSSGLR